MQLLDGLEGEFSKTLTGTFALVSITQGILHFAVSTRLKKQSRNAGLTSSGMC